MPTLSTPRRKPVTPLEKSAAPPAEAERQQRDEPPDLGTLPPSLVKLREKAFAQCMGQRLRGWLAHRGIFLPANYVILHNSVKPRRGSPIDVAYFLPLFLEAMLKAFILFPELVPHEPVEDEEELVLTAGDARRVGLHVIRKRPGKHRPVPTLPGCPGAEGACENLRRVGERYCPCCARVIRERIHAAEA